MRNHSHRRRSRLAREQGWKRPRPGRNPGGARNIDTKPASSNMPSDWYPEKSCAALTKERKQTKQMTNIPRGHRLRNSRMDAIIPIQQIASNIPEPLDNHSTVGAYQNLCQCPSVWVTACR